MFCYEHKVACLHSSLDHGKSICRIDCFKDTLPSLFTFPLNTPGSDPLVRQLYEFEEQIEDPTRLLTPMSRSLWKYRRQVTIEHLGNSFQQEAQSMDVNQYKVLGAFLKQVTIGEVCMVDVSAGDPMLPRIHDLYSVFSQLTPSRKRHLSNE